ncbi:MULTISPECIES: GNAT family N-acetyltransferase [unclassified Streptomyces]|uniref:GNAT family N-acetyltransferase n=1 Tax=unclassified Streptomyces TaxID=2593676 RepID=UPI0023651024|nr:MULTISPECIES: GNAT family N-acetyltransferase [unclassified Streptomyces]MDF3141807.1 GNAT family N-acetyltransferase [Streptomyces sp. T21Q-yed]WDF45096.1 GNAT family N-acetyltransferase [Streptomyces sp. T12]
MIETERLILRRFQLADAAPLAAYRNDRDIARYQAWPSPLTPEAATDQVRKYSKQDPEQPGWFQYAIDLKADHSLAGDLGVLLHGNRMQAELGITLRPDLHRRGYALEAVQAILEYLFTKGLHRVSADCDTRNSPSARLLERAGFQLEGQRPEFTRNINTGEWTDTLLFGLLASRWRELTARGT